MSTVEVTLDTIPALTRSTCKALEISDIVMLDYARSLKAHIGYVMIAYIEIIGLDMGEIEYHDHSKWFPEEFPYYAMHFFGGGNPPMLARAWLHHLQNNEHHWQHWMFPDGFSPAGSDVIDGCLPMPNQAVSEMVADWIGASLAYTGSDDMTAWLKANYAKVRLHPVSKYQLDNLLLDIGYKPHLL